MLQSIVLIEAWGNFCRYYEKYAEGMWYLFIHFLSLCPFIYEVFLCLFFISLLLYMYRICQKVIYMKNDLNVLTFPTTQIKYFFLMIVSLFWAHNQLEFG